MMVVQTTSIPELTEEDIKKIQEKAGPYEQNQWLIGRATNKEGTWRSHDRRLVAPAELCHLLMKHMSARKSPKRKLNTSGGTLT